MIEHVDEIRKDTHSTRLLHALLQLSSSFGDFIAHLHHDHSQSNVAMDETWPALDKSPYLLNLMRSNISKCSMFLLKSERWLIIHCPYVIVIVIESRVFMHK